MSKIVKEDIQPLVEQGYTTQQIADHFSIGTSTVGYYLKKFSLKLRRGPYGKLPEDLKKDAIPPSIKSLGKIECEKLIKECYSLTDFAKKLGYDYYNGTVARIAKKVVQEFDLSMAHFDGNKHKNVKYPTVIKKCPSCDKEFEAKVGARKEKQTCSYGCANKHFRSGDNNGVVAKNGGYKSYSRICFKYHKKKCVVCPEDKIVAVHHYDHNHENNDPKNLVPLCPTHHQYIHSKYKYLVEDKVNEYVRKFIGVECLV